MTMLTRISFACVLLFLLGCSENPGKSEAAGVIYQVPGCGNEHLAKPALGDSSFSSQFDTKLLVDLSVVANCCPDSSRFDLSYGVVGDTISVAVADTAASLCDCVCPYVIHVELSDLPLDHYVLVCDYNDDRAYVEHVWRQTD